MPRMLAKSLSGCALPREERRSARAPLVLAAFVEGRQAGPPRRWENGRVDGSTELEPMCFLDFLGPGMAEINRKHISSQACTNVSLASAALFNVAPE